MRFVRKNLDSKQNTRESPQASPSIIIPFSDALTATLTRRLAFLYNEPRVYLEKIFETSVMRNKEIKDL